MCEASKKYRTAVTSALVLGFTALSIHAQGVRYSGNDQYIRALIAAPRLVTYSADGAADASVTMVGENSAGKVSHPLSSVHAIVNLGPPAIPLLIAHLDDRRLTTARFGRQGPRVTVGYVCLDILLNIVKARGVLVQNCADDGLGACVNEGFYFRPDSSAGQRKVKANWQRVYRKGQVVYHYPPWWRHTDQ